MNNKIEIIVLHTIKGNYSAICPRFKDFYLAGESFNDIKNKLPKAFNDFLDSLKNVEFNFFDANSDIYSPDGISGYGVMEYPTKEEIENYKKEQK